MFFSSRFPSFFVAFSYSGQSVAVCVPCFSSGASGSALAPANLGGASIARRYGTVNSVQSKPLTHHSIAERADLRDKKCNTIFGLHATAAKGDVTNKMRRCPRAPRSRHCRRAGLPSSNKARHRRVRAGSYTGHAAHCLTPSHPPAKQRRKTKEKEREERATKGEGCEHFSARSDARQKGTEGKVSPPPPPFSFPPTSSVNPNVPPPTRRQHRTPSRKEVRRSPPPPPPPFPCR